MIGCLKVFQKENNVKKENHSIKYTSILNIIYNHVISKLNQRQY